jgi:hypothetical protein
MKNIFLVGISDLTVQALNELKDINVRSIYLDGDFMTPKVHKFIESDSNIVIYEKKRLLQQVQDSKYAKIFINYKTENGQEWSEIILQLMQMMDRYASYKFNTFKDRYEMATKLMLYWEQEITRNKPDVTYFSSVPHEVIDFALFHVCKKLGIQTVILREIPTLGLWELSDDYRNIRSKFFKMNLDIKSSKENKYTIIKNAFYRNNGKIYEKIEPKYMELNRIRNNVNPKSVKNIMKFVLRIFRDAVNLRYSDFFKKIYFSFSLYINYKKLSSYYIKVTNNPINLNHLKYVIFYLHFQPEQTTSPLGEQFVDQFKAIYSLRGLIPENISLVVKEHPNQIQRFSTYTAVARDMSFYNSINNLPNTFFLYDTENNLKYMDNAILIATITGTVGFEAYCRNKKVLIFGNAWYEGLPNIYRYGFFENSYLKIILNDNSQKKEVFLLDQIITRLDSSFSYVPNEDYAKNHNLNWNYEESLSTLKSILNYIVSDFRMID